MSSASNVPFTEFMRRKLSMVSRFIRNRKPLLLVMAFVIFSLLNPIPTHAATSVSLDGKDDVVNVMTVYRTTPDTQGQVLAEVSKEEKAEFSKIPGFQDSSILRAQDGSEIVALSQWKGKDLSSFQSYASEHVLNTSATGNPQTFACQVQHTETRSTSPAFKQGDVIMFSQFEMKPGQSQSDLATIVTQEMPGVLEMTPGLQWAAMCPSTDKSTIALMARWGSRADFESLGQQPGFDKETNYWQTYADNEHGLFDVAQVIR
jgi:heme-degrading monooxygenase HmoA